MKIRFLSILSLAALAATVACGGGDDANSETTADTSVVQGTEVVDQPVTVPTQDTIVEETTVTTDTSVIEGGVVDSTVATDTTKRP